MIRYTQLDNNDLNLTIDRADVSPDIVVKIRESSRVTDKDLVGTVITQNQLVTGLLVEM